MAGNAKVINNERQRDVKMRGWIARVYCCCCCYTHSGRPNSQTKHGRTDRRTNGQRELAAAAAVLLYSSGELLLLKPTRSLHSLSLVLFSMLYYAMLCTTSSTGPFVVVPSLTTYRYLRAQLRAETIYSREERVWCHFWIASQAFGSHTHTYSAKLLLPYGPAMPAR